MTKLKNVIQKVSEREKVVKYFCTSGIWVMEILVQSQKFPVKIVLTTTGSLHV